MPSTLTRSLGAVLWEAPGAVPGPRGRNGSLVRVRDASRVPLSWQTSPRCVKETAVLLLSGKPKVAFLEDLQLAKGAASLTHSLRRSGSRDTKSPATALPSFCQSPTSTVKLCQWELSPRVHSVSHRLLSYRAIKISAPEWHEK